MRRSSITVVLLSLVTVLHPPVAGADDPTWSSPLALGPTDVAGIAARGTVVLAGGRPALKETSRVVPGPRTAGLFRSADQGRTWALASEPVVQPDGEIELVPITRTPTLLAMPPTGADAYALFGDEVWRSEDGGVVWRRIGTFPGTPTTVAFLADERPVAGLSTGGLRVSADRGVTWGTLGEGLPASRVNDVLAVDASIVLVATDAGPYRSTTGGAAFTPATSGLLSATAPAMGVAGDAGPGLFLAAPANGSIGTVIYHSTDLGMSWTLLSALAGPDSIPPLSRGALELASSDIFSGIHHLYAGTGSGLYSAGLTAVGAGDDSVSVPGIGWLRSDPEPGRRSVSALARADGVPGASRADAVYAAVRRASPYVTGFTDQVGLASPGWYDELDGGRICGGAAVQRNGWLFVACGSHVFRSKDGGTTFTAVDNGLPYEGGVLVGAGYGPLAISGDGVLWTSGFADGLYRSNTTQTAWTKVAYPGASVTVMEGHPENGNVAYVSGEATNHTQPVVLWRTMDAGTTWLPMLDVGTDITSISATATGRVLVTSGDGVFLSLNGGNGWMRPKGLPSDTLRAVFAPGSPSLAWAATSSGLYRSTDGGLNWQDRGGPPPGASIVPSASDPDVVYRVAPAGRFEASHDGGATWQPFDDGLPPPGAGTVRAHYLADPTHPGRLYVLAGWIDTQNGPESMWVYRAEDDEAA